MPFLALAELSLTYDSQWNTSFGAAALQQNQPPPPMRSNTIPDITSLPDMQGQGLLPLPMGANNMPGGAYTGPPQPSFVSPSMWQESVASVYEGGLMKRPWDYDNNNNMVNQAMKRR